ncbi:MAG TPA: hypothetical protein ENJ95_15495 [Bacteroidetes bacterium]|nr:hypothetical protein [Bacteroidota bacterium]
MKQLHLLSLLFFLSTPVLSQSHYFQQYSVGEGLPQSQVFALLLDSRGYLWLGTQGGGLARFDGISFKNFSEKEGFSGNYVNAIEEADNGDIWIGTEQGASRFDGARFENFKKENGQKLRVNDLAFDEKKNVWLAADGGLFFIKNKNAVREAQLQGKINCLHFDPNGNLWAGGKKGIFKKNKTGKWLRQWHAHPDVMDIASAADGQVYAAVFNHGLLHFDGKKWERISKDDGLPSNFLQTLWIDSEKNIWLGTQDAGVIKLPGAKAAQFTIHNSQFTTLNSSNGLCNNNIHAIAGDPWGNVWLGTSGSGVCRYGGQEFEHFTRSEGLPSNFVYALGKDTSGGMWLSAGDRGAAFFDGERFARFGRDSGFLDIKCRTIHQDLAGRTWFGTEGRGLAVLAMNDDSIPRREFRFFNKKNGLAGNWVRSIRSNGANEIWAATTDGGISKINALRLSGEAGFIKNFGRKEGLADPNVQCLHIDNWGRTWFGTRSGRMGFVFKDRVEMLAKESRLPAATIRCMAEDSLGFLWCGTAGQGIGRAGIYGDTLPVFSFFGRKEGLASANVYLLQFGPQGYLWAGSERGVDRIALDASRNILEVKHYGKAEGFKGVETCQSASLLDDRGNLWFGTVNGLTRYRPLADTARAVKPKIHFTSVNLFYAPLAQTEFDTLADSWGGMKNGAVFPHDKNHLGFSFFAPDFSSPAKMTYSWQLVGSETDWSPFSARREVSYANLPPGEYTFKVRAKNEKGIVGEVLETGFSIEPPFWQTWWFRAAAAGLLVALVGGIFWLRVRQLKQKAAEEKAKLELQNHLLQLEQKARQLQMNPHFIFNALNSIQSLVARKDFDGSRQYILKFGKLMRAVLDNSRKAAIPLEKEVDTLQKYLEMEQFCRDGKFDFKINTEQLESDDLMIPPMLLQPFVENAILHGVAPLKDRKGEIEINFIEDGKRLKVEISDNGLGLDKSRDVGQGEKKRSSAGIAVTRERLGILHGNLEIKNNEGEGTLVALDIPL